MSEVAVPEWMSKPHAVAIIRKNGVVTSVTHFKTFAEADEANPCPFKPGYCDCETNGVSAVWDNDPSIPKL